MEAYFSDQTNVAIPVPSNLRKTGGQARRQREGPRPGRPPDRGAGGGGLQPQHRRGDQGLGSWGVFEIKAGETSRQHGYYMGPGIYARPPRVVAAVGRKRIAKAVKAGKMAAPTTTFTRRGGTSVTVPKVVNSDVPRLLYLRTPQADYQPVASPSWKRAMEKAAETMSDRPASELADRLNHLGLG